MKTDEIIDLYDKYILNTYTRIPVVLIKGKGIKVWDMEGKEYLDFFPGWAVSGLGHCPPRVIKNLKSQANKILHISNNYYNSWQAKLAEVIIKNSFPGKVFFGNSGAEANEGAIKLARAFGNPGRFEIITFQDSFHGRTLATLTATGQAKYQKGFEPLPEGFKIIPFNDLEAVKKNITDRTIGIMIEPIQGEGGINVAKPEFIKFLRNLCDEKDLLLIFDEVQTGIGRTGKLFCYEHFAITPDIVTLAKTLGGGIAVGAMVVKKKFTDVLKPGMHASTFGGNPIACSAGLAVFETIEKDKLLANTVKMGKYLFGQLEHLKKKYSIIKEIRGIGLMLGMELNIAGKQIVENCLKEGLLINCTHDTVLRLMPPLIVTEKDIDKAIKILEQTLKESL